MQQRLFNLETKTETKKLIFTYISFICFPKNKTEKELVI